MGNIEILSLNDDRWDSIVTSFVNYDVYYLSGYVRAFQIHGDGEPELLYYQSTSLRGIYVYMKRRIDTDFFDITTPYGYGGILWDGIIDKTSLEDFYLVFKNSMFSNHIVDNFIRCHPVLRTADNMRVISSILDLGHTIVMDLSSEETIWANLTSKNRNMIRKAERNGVEIKHGKNMRLFDEFMCIYNLTMSQDHADDYYYFKRDFYESIHNDLNEHYEMFYAVYNDQIIAMSIMLFANRFMHYHLSGSLYEFRTLAATNLLLYKAACWGCKQGFSYLHLGGGIGSGEDNLYKFKAAFNRNSNYQFSIGKQIFIQDKYNDLVKERKDSDLNFDAESSFFPLYRS